MDRDRNYSNRDRHDMRDRYDRDDRGFGDKAGDEMRSWFGDEDAERRRRMDRLEAEREEWRNQGRFNDDAGYRGQGRGPGADRSWNMNQNERWGRDPYGDYGDMARSGTGWSGRTSERYPGGTFGGRYGTGVGGRYGPDPSGRSGGGYGPDYGWSDRSERWGASDWSEQAARDRNRDRAGPYEGSRFAGRGPMGYQRSADRIMEDANEALTWAGEVDASEIQVKVDGDEVTLEGTVDSRRAKRSAEDAVERVRGVRDVHNRLRVQVEQRQRTDQGSSTGVGQTQGLSQSQNNQSRTGTNPRNQ